MENPAPAPGDNAPAGNPPRRRSDLRICLVLALLSFLVYNANLRPIAGNDTFAARFLPFIILRDHTVYLDKMENFVTQGMSISNYRVKKGHAVSMYPVVTPALVTPLYLPAVAWLYIKGWTERRLDATAALMEKLSASFIAALSVALLYLLLRRRADARTAVLLAIAYAFGTNTWMIGSQALWQHGMGELLLVICMLLVTGPFSDWRAFAAGVVCALIAFNRPPDALLAVALGVCGLRWAGSRAWLVVAGAIAGAAPLFAYNLVAIGNIAGGYGLVPGASPTPIFHRSLLPGIAGLLFSPGRGLFVFTPFLLFLPFAMRGALRDPRARLLTILICIAIVIQVLLYAELDWRAGAAWGPRWLTDILPLLVWMLAPFAAGMGRAARAVFLPAVGASIAIQAVGAFWYAGSSDEAIWAVQSGPGEMDAAWAISNTPFVVELRHPPAPRDFLLKPDGGCIDSVKAGDRAVAEAAPGTDITVEGWAFTNHHTPFAVRVTLVPAAGTHWDPAAQFPFAQTSILVDRGDVKLAVPTLADTGWHVVLHDDGAPPGDYLLTASAQTIADGEFHRIQQLPFKILPEKPAAAITDDALPGIARALAARLRDDQQPPGYWLARSTRSPVYDNPGREMNTFFTSLMVDILDPVAQDAGLGDNLARARAHLLSEIEPSGLVRYHGRPDSPAGTPPGYYIMTPDTDDTAMVWRVTGGDAALLPRLLETLKSYRTPEGLYRSWLAPAGEHQNVDPGRIDIGVEMHLLMFLANVDPPAARDLHTALQRAIDGGQIWVYYAKTPLVPILRQADLDKAGYPLVLPQSRLQASVPGQEPWVAACRLLAQYETGNPKPSGAETLALLKTLAAGDFSYIRKNPPLLYNGDLAAEPQPPFYWWSEDYGYALWLRLWFASGHASSAAPQ